MQQPSGPLSLALDHIDALIASDEVVERLKQRLAIARERCAEELDEILDIEGYIKFTPDAPAMPLQEIFEQLGFGRISLQGKEDTIIRPSSILGPMFRKGFNFASAHRFSKAEMDIATFIGDNFDMLSPALRALRSPKKDRKDEAFQIAWPERNDPAFVKLLELNRRFNFLEIKSLKFPSKEGAMFNLKSDIQSKVVNDQKGLFLFRFLEGPARGLIMGDWMTAYVHGIIRDQLHRHGKVEHELYAKLNYRAPGDVVNHSSDFDVIGRFANSIIMFECKSGRITPQSAQEIITKTNHLVEALELKSANDPVTEVHLVYDPHINPQDEMASLFEDSPINLLIPKHVRGLVREVTES